MYFHFVLFSRVAKKKVKEKIPTENFSIFSYCKKKKPKKLKSFFLVFSSLCLEKLLSPSL